MKSNHAFQKTNIYSLTIILQQHNAVLENLKAIKSETYIFFFVTVALKNNKHTAKNSFKYHHHIYWHVNICFFTASVFKNVWETVNKCSSVSVSMTYRSSKLLRLTFCSIAAIGMYVADQSFLSYMMGE